MNKKSKMIDKLGNIISLTGTAVLMNLTFLVFSLPIVTIGQAWCGLMSAIRYNIRGEGWFKGFMIGFKRRFLRGTIAWIIGLLGALYLLNDIQVALTQSAVTNEAIAPLIASCAMFAFLAVLLHSALTLNVYIPTNVSNWIRNTVNLGLKGFIQVLVGAAFFWGPALVFCFVSAWLLYELAIVLLFAYFAVGGLVTTMLLKGQLTAILVDCRKEGLLTAEEGAAAPQEEEDGEA